LLPKSDPEMRRAFRKLVVRCGLDPDDYKPYSLRRGGATHLYKITGNMGLVIERLRWANIKTTRIYVQEAEAMLKELHLSTSQANRIQTGRLAFHRICGIDAA
jgi:integrase